jgi:hypothetical protein
MIGHFEEQHDGESRSRISGLNISIPNLNPHTTVTGQDSSFRSESPLRYILSADLRTFFHLTRDDDRLALIALDQQGGDLGSVVAPKVFRLQYAHGTGNLDSLVLPGLVESPIGERHRADDQKGIVGALGTRLRLILTKYQNICSSLPLSLEGVRDFV